jgi:hypothetical protein
MALLVLLALIAMGTLWSVVSGLDAASNELLSAKQAHNARVLAQAKLALMGYVAAQANKSAENNPGSLPCPENPADFDSAYNQGKVGSGCASSLKVGRFPWRTLGLDKLVDYDGEPLWYVVSTNWGPSTSNVINSNTTSGLTVDGVANAAIALIIAPGAALNVPTSTGCTAWSQARITTGTPDWRNYLECENATSPADVTFVTTGPSGAFNDQVITLTAAEMLPMIEASVANRIERDFGPALTSMYSGGSWSASSWIPYAAAFGDPTTSNGQGSTAVQGTSPLTYSQGLLPLTYAETSPGSGTLCTAGVSVPRCAPNFVAWTSASYTSPATLTNPSCTFTSTTISCSYYRVCAFFCLTGGSITFTLTAEASNVGRAMRQLNSAATMTNVNTAGRTLTGQLLSTAAATLTLAATADQTAGGGSTGATGDALCNTSLAWFQVCRQETFTVPITVLADHQILDTSDSTYGWFVRNKWHEVSYYVVQSGFVPGGVRSCTDSTSCLTVNNHTTSAGVSDAGKQRALILLAGRTLTGATRPNATLTDWFEGANADGVTPFEARSTTLVGNRTFNDRVAVLSKNP